MKKLVLLLAAVPLLAEPRIFYSKSFPGSTPAYVEILLEPTGKAVYKESAQDELPIKFEMTAAEAADIFSLARKLDRFSRPLESGLNVAKMGEKTFRWEEPPSKSEVKFNYSTDVDAQALQNWFEKMTETVQLYLMLERAVKFDKLGTNKALLLLQAGMDRQRVVAGPLFLPLLDRVVKNDSYLNMARERAAVLAETIRNPKPKATAGPVE